MTNLNNVRVGDKVLLGLVAKAPCAIATVTRLTKTQILLTWPDALVEHRYERKTGYKVGSRALGLRIKGIATPEEAVAIEHRLAERQRKAEDDLRHREAIDTKRSELVGLFPGGYQAHVAEDIDKPGGLWILSLDGLTEQDIRELADFMHMPEFRFRT